MNERIRELADQILPNEKEFNKGDPKDWGYFFSGEELEKFAELIIKECLIKCDGVQTMYGQYTFTATKCKEAIKEHFGVEECV